MRFDPSDSFPHYEKKYLCSCCNVHCRVVAVKIAIFLILCVGISISGHFYLNTPWNIVETVAMALTGFSFLITVLLLVGLYSMNSQLVLPFVFLQISWMLNSFFSMAIMFICLVNPSSSVAKYFRKQPTTIRKSEQLKLDAQFRGDCAFAFFSAFSAFLLCYWFYTVAWKCYVYLRDYGKFRRDGTRPETPAVKFITRV